MEAFFALGSCPGLKAIKDGAQASLMPTAVR